MARKKKPLTRQKLQEFGVVTRGPRDVDLDEDRQPAPKRDGPYVEPRFIRRKGDRSILKATFDDIARSLRNRRRRKAFEAERDANTKSAIKNKLRREAAKREREGR